MTSHDNLHEVSKYGRSVHGILIDGLRNGLGVGNARERRGHASSTNCRIADLSKRKIGQGVYRFYGHCIESRGILLWMPLGSGLVRIVWVPYSLAPPGLQVLIVRTAQDPATMLDLVRKEVWAADSGVALASANTLEEFINERMYAGPRFGFVIMTIFGCVGLILVTVGVYSVSAHSTARKTHEIGIRMALGARPGNVLGKVIGSGLRLVLLASRSV